jgi:hypothetical protein
MMMMNGTEILQKCHAVLFILLRKCICFISMYTMTECARITSTAKEMWKILMMQEPIPRWVLKRVKIKLRMPSLLSLQQKNDMPLAQAEAKSLAKKFENYEITVLTVLWKWILQRMNSVRKSL